MIKNYEIVPSGSFVLMDVTMGDTVKSSDTTPCKSANIAVVVLDGDHTNLPSFIEMDGSPSGRTVLNWINR